MGREDECRPGLPAARPICCGWELEVKEERRQAVRWVQGRGSTGGGDKGYRK